MDSLENVGLERRRLVFRLRKSDILKLEIGISQNSLEQILSCFTLPARKSWREIPGGFEQQDIQAWRYGRQLSAIRRPLIPVIEGEDPEFVIAPGFIREAVVYVLRGHYDTTYHDRKKGSDKPRFGPAMSKWYDVFRNEHGNEFSLLVSETLKGYGWLTAKCEIGLRELLGTSKDREFGDLQRYGDVDVLAWHEKQKRVLVIECKHLLFRKTAGEIAEQLSDYRGKPKRNGKPDDLLKHLNRLELISARKAEFCKTMKIGEDYEIEGWTLFKYPVPMLYAWKDFESKSGIAIFDEIQKMLDH